MVQYFLQYLAKIVQYFTKTLQGEPADKKLAPRKVPPFVLKNEGKSGPKVTFNFLKMWKLAARGPIRARTIESLHSATEISSIDSLRAMPL